MIDVHSHIQVSTFDDTRDDLIAQMKERNIESIVVGICEKDSLDALHLSKKHNNLYATLGIHPLEKKGDVSNMEGHLSDENVVAIGECGLDYTRTDNLNESKKIQSDRLWEHINLASKYSLPLMIHVRTMPDDIDTSKDAHKDLVSMIKEVNRNIETPPHFHIHFFTEKKYAESLLSLGCTFSFSGVVTFVKEYEETVSMIPIQSILSETDSPYAAPHPKRGTKNNPLNVEYIVEKLANIKGISREEMENTIYQNASKIFLGKNRG